MKKIPNKKVSAEQNFIKVIENNFFFSSNLKILLWEINSLQIMCLFLIQVWSKFCSTFASIYANHNRQKQYCVKMKEMFNLTLRWELLYSLQLFYLHIEVLTFNSFQLVKMAVFVAGFIPSMENSMTNFVYEFQSLTAISPQAWGIEPPSFNPKLSAVTTKPPRHTSDKEAQRIN